MNFKEFFLERYGNQRKLEGIWYHGTSAKFLPSILKNGLRIDTKEKSWGEDPDSSLYSIDRTSYGGVYITRTLHIATGAAFRIAHRTDSNRLIVIMNIQPKTLLADEDDFAHTFAGPISTDIDTHNYKELKYHSPNGQISPETKKDRQKWVTDKLRKIYYLVGELHPTLLTRLTNLITDEGYFAYVTRVASYISKDEWRSLWDLREIKEDDIPPLPTSKEGEQIFRTFIDKVTRLLKHVPKKGSETGRSLQNIGFSGTNKILAIVEMLGISRLHVRYGKLPTDFIRAYTSSIDSSVTIYGTNGEPLVTPDPNADIRI